MTEKTRYVDQVKQSMIADAAKKEKPKTKDEKSAFDLLLKESQLKQNPNLYNPDQPAKNTVTREAIKETLHQDEQRKNRNRDDEKSDKKEGGERSSEGRGTEGTKVHAKGAVKDQGQGGGSGKGGKDKGGFGSNQGSSKTAKKELLGKKSGLSGSQVEGNFSRQIKLAFKEAFDQKATKLDQEIINQLVKFVKIGRNERDEEEMELHFRREVFEGLKLKVSNTSDGKVRVRFTAPDKDVRAIFEDNKEKILAALTKEGIDVDEIVVS